MSDGEGQELGGVIPRVGGGGRICVGGRGGLIRVGVAEVCFITGCTLFRVPMDSVDATLEYEDDQPLMIWNSTLMRSS